jgi:PPE-repeat protein
MKATTEQQKTIKEIVLKTLEYYIIKQNKKRSEIIEAIKKDTLNLCLKQIYFNGFCSIKFNDESINVLRLENGQRLFEYNCNFDYYLGNLNDDNVNSVLNIIRKELI